MYSIKRYEDVSKAGTSAGAVKGWVTRRRGGGTRAAISAIKASEASSPKSGSSRRRGGLSPKAKAGLKDRVAREYREKNGMPPGKPGGERMSVSGEDKHAANTAARRAGMAAKTNPEAKKKHKSLERDVRVAAADVTVTKRELKKAQSMFEAGSIDEDALMEYEGPYEDAQFELQAARESLLIFEIQGDDQPLPKVEVGTGKTKPKTKAKTKANKRPKTLKKLTSEYEALTDEYLSTGMYEEQYWAARNALLKAQRREGIIDSYQNFPAS